MAVFLCVILPNRNRAGFLPAILNLLTYCLLEAENEKCARLRFLVTESQAQSGSGEAGISD
jgi:hypothetical protein